MGSIWRRHGLAVTTAVLALGALTWFLGSTDARAAPVPSTGLVSAATPEAARAGASILASGGNAVDAAVAVAFSLAVTEPAGSGLAGQIFLILHPPGGPAVAIMGTSQAPAILPQDVQRQDLRGRRAATVPSFVAALDVAWRRYGSGEKTWGQLLAAAIAQAEEGFVLGAFRQAALARSAEGLRRDAAAAAAFLGEDGAVPEAGTRVRQPQLAATLRRLAESGATDFYRGEIARAIAEDMAEHGGWISERDLAAFPAPDVSPALEGSYRAHQVWTAPPPGGGWVVLLALNILERAPPAELSLDHPGRTIWLAEALRAAHRSRLEAPIRHLVDYRAEVEHHASKSRARDLVREFGPLEGGETTHFSVVDGKGFAVAVTQSLNSYFGARVMAGELGFLYNDYMREFVTDEPQHPYALGSGAVPFSSMSPAILARSGSARLVVGSPGSRRIVSAVTQVVSAWIDAKVDVRTAVEAPRLHVVPEDERLLLETPLASNHTLLALERRGFGVSVPLSSLSRQGLNPYFGGVHALAREPDGTWRGAADPRRDGAVAPTP